MNQHGEYDNFEIILATLIGTSCMTLFSYAMSYIRNKQFREPELLNEMLVRVRLLRFTSSIDHPTGWIIHYSIGLIFILLFYAVTSLTALRINFWFCLAAGAISGIIGITAWHVTFKMHPNPPMTDRKEFYRQLEVAQIIFGATAYLGIWIL